MTKSQRKNITQPADWWAAFELEAKKWDMTLSEWVGECCKANLPNKSGLSERPAANRPKKPRDKGK